MRSFRGCAALAAASLLPLAAGVAAAKPPTKVCRTTKVIRVCTSNGPEGVGDCAPFLNSAQYDVCAGNAMVNARDVCHLYRVPCGFDDRNNFFDRLALGRYRID